MNVDHAKAQVEMNLQVHVTKDSLTWTRFKKTFLPAGAELLELIVLARKTKRPQHSMIYNDKRLGLCRATIGGQY